MTTEDLLIDAILAIGNDKEAVAILEPNIMQPLKLERWMVERILKVWELILEELESG